MKRVIGIGACVLDTLIECDTYPKEDTKYRASRILKTGGGPVANALVALAKMGIQADFAGSLSDDAEGHFLAHEFQRYGVGTEFVCHIPETSAFTSYVLLSRDGASRTCVFHRGNVPDNPDALDLSILKNADILHLDGNYLETAIAAAKYAKANGIPVSLDAGGLYAGIDRLLPYVDILIPSEEFAMGITGANTAEQAAQQLADTYHPQILAVTQGVRGGILYEDGTLVRYCSYPVNCVDSNGAGDTFHGAFLAAYLHGYDTKTCCQIASATSAIKCTRVGMRDALPTLPEVLTFLKDQES